MISAIRKLSRKGLLASLLLATGLNAMASTWVPIAVGDIQIIIPQPSIDSVQANAEQYGASGTVTLNGLGASSAAYYQLHQLVSGSWVVGSWACQDIATITANNNNITLTNLAYGQYKVRVAAEMGGSACDLASYQGGSLVTSSPVESNTFSLVNRLPVAANDSVSIAEDSTTIIDVLVNDTDVDGHTLTVSSVAAANGSAVITADSKVSYTPNNNYNGTDTINYTVGDGFGGSASAAVTVSISAVNDNPIAVNDSMPLAEDVSSTINVMLGDSDPDGDSLTLTSATVAYGQVAITADNKVSYTPVSNFNGVNVIEYSITDGHGGTASAQFTLNVTPVNDSPIAQRDTIYLNLGDSVTIDALVNDTDVDGDTLSIVKLGPVALPDPSLGAAAISSDKKSITYQSTGTSTGTDTFSYVITDASIETSGIISVVISGNMTPTVTPSTPVDAAQYSVTDSVTASATASDSDGSITQIEFRINGGLWQIDSTPPYSWDFGSHSVGAHTIEYRAKDNGNAYSNVAIRSISVIAGNTKPVISGTPSTLITVAQAYTFVPTASDIDNNPLTFSIQNKPAWADFDTTTGALTGTPQANDVGIDSNIIISVTDGTDTASLEAFDIEVATFPVIPSITSPLNNSQETVGDFIVQVTVSDEALTHDVKFSADGGAWVSDADGVTPWLYDFGSLSAGNHSIAVKVIAAAGESPEVTVNVELVLGVPEVVIDYTAETASYIVKWGAVAGASSYRIEESIDNGAWAELAAQSDTSKEFLSQPAGNYNYRVKACDAVGTCSLMSAPQNVNVGGAIGQCPAQ